MKSVSLSEEYVSRTGSFLQSNLSLYTLQFNLTHSGLCVGRERGPLASLALRRRNFLLIFATRSPCCRSLDHRHAAVQPRLHTSRQLASLCRCPRLATIVGRLNNASSFPRSQRAAAVVSLVPAYACRWSSTASEATMGRKVVLTLHRNDLRSVSLSHALLWFGRFDGSSIIVF